MTKLVTKKRLNEIEIQLTPKEWGIRLVDEMQKYPSENAFMKTVAQGLADDSPWMKPFLILEEQGKERFPGKKPGDIRARDLFLRKLITDWQTLKNLVFTVNEKTAHQAESTGLKVLFQLSMLRILSLQECFESSAGEFVEWLKRFKTTDDGCKEEYRPVILKELAAFRDAHSGGILVESLLLGHTLRRRLHESIEDWVQDFTALIADILEHEAAVKVIQDKYFDGHPILFQDTATKLAETIVAIEEGVSTFNEYLRIRETLFVGDKNKADKRDEIVSAIQGESNGPLMIDMKVLRRCSCEQDALALADAWVKFEREKAVAELLEGTGEHETYLWEKFQETFGL